MCGRFSQIPITRPEQLPWPELHRHFAQLPVRYNLAPGQNAGVLLRDANGTRLAKLYWGLLPFWAKSLALAHHTFNARIETLNDKPAFRAAFKARHAVIPIAGYYEWKSTATGKQPYYLCADHAQEVLWLAGLWEPKHPLLVDGSEGSFTLITQAADGLPAHVHTRMPVFLAQRDLNDWLGLERGPSLPFLLTRSLPALNCFPVSRRANTSTHDDAQLIEPIHLP